MTGCSYMHSVLLICLSTHDPVQQFYTHTHTHTLFLIWLYQVLVGAHEIFNLHCSMWDLILSAYRIQFPDLQWRRDLGLIPGFGRSSGKGHGTHSRLLAWKSPWTEEPGGLQSMGSQRVRHDWATFTFPDVGPPVLGAQSLCQGPSGKS